MQNLVVVSHTVHVGGPKIWGTLGPAPLGWGSVDDIIETRIHIRYHTKFGCCRSNRIGVNRGSQKFRRRWAHAPLGWGVADPKKCFCPCVLPSQIWSL